VTEAEIQRRREDWSLLEAYLAKDISALSDEQMVEFVRLYRGASRDLAYFRAQPGTEPAVEYLNGLAGMAYGALYRRPTRSFWDVLESSIYGGAAAFRRRAGFVLAAFLIFLSFAVLGPLAAMASPDVRQMLVPEEMQASFEGWAAGELPDRSSGESAGATAFYAVNNPLVGLRTVALGAMTMGVGAVYILAFNGVIIGMLTGLVAQKGSLLFLFGSILPHGVSELGGIFVVGGVGLMLGWAVLRPGRRTRGESFRSAGRDAIPLTGLGLVMIFAAAPIEGWFSFNPGIPLPFKWAFAAAAFAAWTAYLSGYGRHRDGLQSPEA
jgi:uncharacterized membrane protein SpoIIM required for sporulation